MSFLPKSAYHRESFRPKSFTFISLDFCVSNLAQVGRAGLVTLLKCKMLSPGALNDLWTLFRTSLNLQCLLTLLPCHLLL